MTDAGRLPGQTATPPPPRHRRYLRWFLAGAALAIVGGYVYSTLTLPSTRQLTVAGHRYEVLYYANQTLITLVLGGQRRVDHLLWLKYYAPKRDTARTRSQAHEIASRLCPVADSFALPYIRVTPVEPIGPRGLRLSISWDYWFTLHREANNCDVTEVPDPRG